jgi:hypothetical protein
MAKTGRPTMTNETGVRNNTVPSLVTTMLQNFDHLNFPYVIWISGSTDNIGTEYLCDPNTGVLYPTGLAFSNFMLTY